MPSPTRVTRALLVWTCLACLVSIAQSQSERPLILLTNAGGIRSVALRNLARALHETADVFVAAPTGRRLGASQCLPLPGRIRMERLDDGVFAIDSSPAGCVAIAIRVLSPDRPFDLVVSGIDAGLALGADANLSGTLGAARMAADLGVPGIALSIAPGSRDLPAAVSFTHELVKEALERKLPSTTVLNVNFPGGSFRQWRKPMLAPLGGRTLVLRFEASRDGVDRMTVKTEVRPYTGPVPEGCDVWAHRRGHITITPVPVLTAPPAEIDFESWRIFNTEAERYAPSAAGKKPGAPAEPPAPPTEPKSKQPAPVSPPKPRKEA